MTANYRALVHTTSLLVPVLAEATSPPLTVVILCLMVVVYVAEEFLRLRGRHLPLASNFTIKMSRSNEKDHFITAPAFLAIGIILVLLVFPRSIAYASIVIVAVGDPLAGWVGGKFGRLHIGLKSLEGFAIGTLAAFSLTLFLVPASIGIIGSIVGMILELSGILDDNLTIPLGSGTVMYLATALLPHATA